MSIETNKITQELKKIETLGQASLRPNSVLFMSTTTPRTGLAGFCLQALEDSTFSVLTIDNLTGDTNITSKTLIAGSVLYGAISAVTLATGCVIVYS